MLEFGELLTFLVATVILNLTPGSDVLFVATQSIGGGLKGGISAAFGVSFGIIFHICAVAFGLAELLTYYPMAFHAVKLAGAAYLFFLAYQSLKNGTIDFENVQSSNLKVQANFLRGVLTNILNPKVALFFLAFLPQFIHAERGSLIQQTFFLGAIFIVSGTLINLSYAVLF